MFGFKNNIQPVPGNVKDIVVRHDIQEAIREVNTRILDFDGIVIVTFDKHGAVTTRRRGVIGELGAVGVLMQGIKDVQNGKDI